MLFFISLFLFTIKCITIQSQNIIIFIISINRPIGRWDVSNVVDMSDLFAGLDCNPNIVNWNVGKVTNFVSEWSELLL
jgi:hypothetical protein